MRCRGASSGKGVQKNEIEDWADEGPVRFGSWVGSRGTEPVWGVYKGYKP